MHKQNIIIVGAGIVGLSTAYALLKQGIHTVTVLEQAKVDHPRSASYGISRLLRFEYGPDSFYTQLVQRSLSQWHILEHDARRTLYTPTGLLVLGTENDGFTQPSYRVLRELELPTMRLSHQQCRQRFPQFVTNDYDMYTYNTEAGILHASTCLRTLRDLILDLGGEICEVSRVKHIDYGNYQRPLRVTLHSGEEYNPDRLVLAIGSWLHHLLGNLQLPVHMTRQYLLYFANLPIDSFGVHAFPAFIASELYGFPIHSTFPGGGPSWFKAASHNFGIAVEPEESSPIEDILISQVVRKLCNLLPALQEAQLVRVDACMYDVSPDENFILDTLPCDSRVAFATGLSGHGFKFGLVLGELLSSLVQGIEPPVSIERFKLSRFAKSDVRVQQHSSVA